MSRLSRINRIARVGLGSPPAVLSHQIVSIVANDTAATVTTSGPHGIIGNPIVAINGSSVAGYNSPWLVQSSIDSPTTFVIDTFLGDATGGRWDYA